MHLKQRSGNKKKNTSFSKGTALSMLQTLNAISHLMVQASGTITLKGNQLHQAISQFRSNFEYNNELTSSGQPKTENGNNAPFKL